MFRFVGVCNHYPYFFLRASALMEEVMEAEQQCVITQLRKEETGAGRAESSVLTVSHSARSEGKYRLTAL